jgi:hypothetical protein
MTTFYEVFFACAVVFGGGGFLLYKFLQNRKKVKDKANEIIEDVKAKVDEIVK